MEYRSALLAIDYLTSKITLETGKMVDNQYFEVNMMKIYNCPASRRQLREDFKISKEIQICH